MACHSSKDRGGSKDDYSWSSEIKNLLMDKNSNTEAEEPNLRSRSNTKRYNRLVAKSFSFCLVNNRSVSSSIFEFDEQDQEEVAECLMMLSMDSRIRNGVNSGVESSDNNFAVLETKSSSVDMKVARKDCLKPTNNLDETHQRCKEKVDGNLKLNALIAEAQSENSDSGKVYETNENGRNADNGPSYIYKRKHRETFSNRKPVAHDVNYNPEKKMKPKKLKGHECLLCNRMFKSGQALGGHKRSHFLVGS